MGGWRQPNMGIQRFSRITATLPVRISTVDPETDPSTGKHFFRSSEEIVVDIDLPDARDLQLVARVAWTQRQLRSSRAGELDSPGYGIEFSEASSMELARLERYLDSLEPRDEKPRSIDAPIAPPVTPQP